MSETVEMSETDAAILRCEGLRRVYGSGVTQVTALAEASLSVRAGELVILRGPSGSGKTTLLNLLGGLDVPTAGRVWLGERELTTASEQQLVEARREDIGYVFQSFALLPVLSAAENVELPLRILETPPAERDARVAELLDMVGLRDHAHQRPYELSGGQQQRVGIARALANRPRVLIADEPTGQLDSETGESMMRLIAGLVHENGVAAIISTHDPRMAAFADRILEIRDGRLDDHGQFDDRGQFDQGRHGRRSSGATPDGRSVATPSADDLPAASEHASLEGTEGTHMTAASGDTPPISDEPADLLSEEGPDLEESEGAEAPDVETHSAPGAHTNPTDPLNIDDPTPDADLSDPEN